MARQQNERERAISGLLGTGNVRGLSVLKRISQATFDEAVRENVEEFEMSRKEAIDETLKQFKSQGCDLSDIVLEKP